MIIESTGEDFDYHWGFIDYNDKTVLDLGADYGSTADCFLKNGAKKVYAVEGDTVLYHELASKLAANKLPINKIIPINKMIKSEFDFMEIFIKIDADIVKIDIEADEVNLVKVPDNLLRKYKDYIIEAHHTDIKNRILEKFKNINYELKLERPLAVNGFNVIHLTRND